MDEENRNAEAFEEDDEYIYLEDEDGTEVAFSFLDRIEYKGDEYLVLEPTDEEDNGVVILQVEPSEDEEDGETYYGIEDDNILNAVFRIFKERFRGVIDFGD